MDNIYYFIDKFDRKEIFRLDKKISIIYRNYKDKNADNTINELKKVCKKDKRELFISNNLKVALKHNLNGLYLPSFNTCKKYRNLKKNFKIIGSAHNFREIKIKENQGCTEIFIAPLFANPKNKNYLDIIKFNNLSLSTNKRIIALGGINEKNIRKLICTEAIGFAGITWIKKTGLIKLGRFKYFS